MYKTFSLKSNNEHFEANCICWFLCTYILDFNLKMKKHINDNVDILSAQKVLI